MFGAEDEWYEECEKLKKQLTDLKSDVAACETALRENIECEYPAGHPIYKSLDRLRDLHAKN